MSNKKKLNHKLIKIIKTINSFDNKLNKISYK